MANFKLTIVPQFINTDDEDNAVDASGNPAFTPNDARDILNIHHSIGYAAKDKSSVNVKGTVTINFNLGNERHRCIGHKQDRRNHSVLYFLWCSDSNKHKILRYHRRKTDTANPYGIIEKLVEYPFRWKQRTRITGISLVQDNDKNLLYWNDNIGPRKVNIEKASLLNKTKMWDVYLPTTFVFANTVRVTINLRTAANTVPVLPPTVSDSYTFFLPPQTSNDAALEFLSNAINSNGANSAITSEFCDCRIKISSTYSTVERVNIRFEEFPSLQAIRSLVVPDNWYGVDLIDRIFDQGKWPSPIEPSCVFGQDSTKSNQVKGIVWQFRAFGVYDDAETSVLSPISLIPIDNVVCNPVLENRLNYIDINFSDASILDPKVLTIFKQIVVCARQTNEGIWKEYARLKVCDYFDIDANNNAIAHYKFYNDTVGVAIPEQDVIHQYDALPILPRAQEFFKGKQIQAGMEKDVNYKRPDCVDMRITPRFLEDPSVPLRKVTFRVRVLSQQLDDNADLSGRNNFPDINEARGPIMHNKGRPTLDYPFFGGLHYGTGGGQDTKLTSNMEGKYEQNLPEGGWFCYPAGTDYGAISKQINVGLPTTKDGAVIVGNGGVINDDLVDRLGEYLDPSPTTRDLYSEVTVLVPDNTKYKFRLASHWCSFGDKLQKGSTYDLNNGRMCHRTSTHVWGVIRGGDLGFPNTGYWSPEFEIEVNVNGADIPLAGTFIVKDLSRVESEEEGQLNYPTIPIVGYLFDALGSVDEDDLRKNGIPVHRAFMTETTTGGSAGPPDPLALGLSERQKCFTDHNGFFYFNVNKKNSWALHAFQVSAGATLATSTNIAYAAMASYASYSTVFNVRSAMSAFRLPRSIQDLQEAQMTAAPTELNPGALNQFLLATSSEDARNQCSTIVTGTFVDQNNVPIEGVSVILGGGGQDISDENGKYRIVAWGDMIGFFTLLPENNNDRRANMIFGLPAYFKATGTNQYLVYIPSFGANPTPTPPPYSPTAVYDLDAILGVVQLTLTSPIIFKSWKSGAWYTPGIVHFDQLLRQDSVSFQEDMKVYIPFVTERNALRGPALLDYVINGLAPSTAHYYQLVMRRDQIHANYLTWLLNDVKYIISGENVTTNGVTSFEYVESSYGNTDANMILLDISNITDYAGKNFDTRIGYTWKKGDKIRFIRKEDTSFFSGIVEFEVISFEQPSFLVINNTDRGFELKAGMLTQVYSLKKDVATDFFYERGEAFPCTAPGTSNNAYSRPTGTFRGGDTYWRNRSIPISNDEQNIINTIPYYMECDSISDFYDSQDADEGRIQVYDNAISQLTRPALMRVSDAYVPNTNINGLSRFRSQNYKELDSKDGFIVSLKTPGEILHVVQENAMISNYIERLEQNLADGSTNLIATTQYFGTANRLQGAYGSQHPESVALNEDYVFQFDAKQGIDSRRANNGLFKISDYKARSYFKKYSDAEIWDAAGVFYREFELRILTIWEQFAAEALVFSVISEQLLLRFAVNNFGLEIGDTVTVTFFDRATSTNKTLDATVILNSGNDVIVLPEWGTFANQVIAGDTVVMKYRGTADTIAFSEPDNRWPTRFSFAQDCYEQIGDELVSWKNGILVIHDKSAIRNNFNGVQYTSQIRGIFNGSQDIKIWKAIFLDQVQDNGGCDWEFIDITNKKGQQSRLLKNNLVPQIIELEQYWHSELKKDLNTVGVNNPIVNGRELRSSELSVLLENNYTGEAMLRSINVFAGISKRNTE